LRGADISLNSSRLLLVQFLASLLKKSDVTIASPDEPGFYQLVPLFFCLFATTRSFAFSTRLLEFLSQGIPRLINQFASQALLEATAKNLTWHSQNQKGIFWVDC
jgi:hypothetical protein